MESSAPSAVWYVYGIIPAEPPPMSLPSGLDDRPVVIERSHEGRIAALVSRLDDPEYAPSLLEARSGDVDWLSPRAVAHDQVLTWASDQGAVVPLPMFSLFSGREAVQDMLRDRATQLEATLRRLGDGREYALHIYRVDGELLSAIVDLSPRIRELADAAAAASPGQRYLLERKLEAEKRGELRGVTREIVEDMIARLSPFASAVEQSPIPRVAEAEASRGTMVLNASFLVSPSRLDEFQRALTALVQERGEQGFRFDFNGPWPPYHFVGERANVT